MKKIKHNSYDEAGKLTGTFYLEYPENETEDRINLTDELIDSIGKRMKGNQSFNSYYGGYEKPVYFHDKKVQSMSGSNDEITVVYEDGKKYVKKFANRK